MEIKDMFDRLFALGIGAAIASKEQLEKVVDDLVEKGKVAKDESSDVVEELIKKGKEYQSKWESSVKEKVQQTLRDNDFVTKAEFDELNQRVMALEEQLKAKNDSDKDL